MHKSSHRLAWLLLLGGLTGAGRMAQADEAPSPLAAMRAAAEEAAETLPAPPLRAAPTSLPKARTLSPSSPIQGVVVDSVQTEIRKAVQAEVARELARDIRQGPGPGRSAGSSKADGSNSAKEAREDAHGAALQAQNAKAIGLQHSMGLAKGQGKAVMRDPLGAGRSSGAGGMPRSK